MAFLLQQHRSDSQIYLGVVTVPRALPRVFRLPSSESTIEYTFLHDIAHARLFNLYDQTPRPDLKYKPFIPKELPIPAEPAALFHCLRERDVLLHHPYDSYSTVVRFIESTAVDPDVLSIKQTLYRTSEDSPIVRALMEAASKKEVTDVA